MNSATDQQLLREYAEHRSEDAFAELVRRHVDFVYSAALRMTGDASSAEDVAQGVFVALMQKADQLAERPVLAGWLHCTSRNLAGKVIRSEMRRRAREQEAAAMNELHCAEADAPWERIAPHLDAALSELNESDRDAVILRYFERKSAREMAECLGISQDAAQRRLTRAVERLRDFFKSRGIAVGASSIIVVISAHGVHAAPATLGIAITASAAAFSIPSVTTTSTLTKGLLFMASTKSKLVIASVAALLLATGGIGTLLLNRSSSSQRGNASKSLARGSLGQDEQTPQQGTLNLTASDMKDARTNEGRIEVPVQGGVMFLSGPSAARRGANPELLVHTISFKGNSVFAETELAKVIASKVGEPADQAKIDRDVVAIQKLYGQAGYRNISVRAAKETDKSAGRGSLLFVVAEPPPK